MEIIRINLQKASQKLFSRLERKKLIRVIKPSAKVINTRTKTGAVDYFYRENAGCGGHCLLGVGKRNTEIEFSFHPGNEDLILLKPRRGKYKALYFVLSLLKKDKFIKALGKGALTQKDFLAVELEYNNPETMFFTVLNNTVHCEVTAPGPGRHPVFFVTEPSKLRMNLINTEKYKFTIKHSVTRK